MPEQSAILSRQLPFLTTDSFYRERGDVCLAKSDLDASIADYTESIRLTGFSSKDPFSQPRSAELTAAVGVP